MKLGNQSKHKLDLYGIFGHPLTHSLSPQMQNGAFKALKLKAYYLFLETSPTEFKRILRAKKKLALSGFNVTVPHKEAVLPFLDQTSREVEAVGACNTVTVRGSKWRGDNTDVYGFLKGLEEKKFNPKGKDVVVLGAGGASRAVVYALLSKGIRSLIVFNRTLSKAQQMIREFSKKFSDCMYAAADFRPKTFEALIAGKDLVVNTTSLGLNPKDPSPVPSSHFPKAKRGALAYDLIYSGNTAFLKTAVSKGYATQNGRSMLLYQGAKSFEIWTGKKAPLNIMRKSLEQGSFY